MKFCRMQFYCSKMWYSIEPKKRIYVKGYGFLSFAKNMGKFFDTAKKYTTDAIKTASKKAIGAEATGDLIGYKIADKITNLLKNLLRSTLEKYKMIK